MALALALDLMLCRRRRKDYGLLGRACLLGMMIVGKCRVSLIWVAQRDTLHGRLLLSLLVGIAMCLSGRRLLDARGVGRWRLLVHVQTSHVMGQGVLWAHAARRWRGDITRGSRQRALWRSARRAKLAHALVDLRWAMRHLAWLFGGRPWPPCWLRLLILFLLLRLLLLLLRLLRLLVLWLLILWLLILRLLLRLLLLGLWVLWLLLLLLRLLILLLMRRRGRRERRAGLLVRINLVALGSGSILGSLCLQIGQSGGTRNTSRSKARLDTSTWWRDNGCLWWGRRASLGPDGGRGGCGAQAVDAGWIGDLQTLLRLRSALVGWRPVLLVVVWERIRFGAGVAGVCGCGGGSGSGVGGALSLGRSLEQALFVWRLGARRVG
jgi:hypothetical protein